MAKRKGRYGGVSGVRVGTYAFSYNVWEGLIFPPGLPREQRLASLAQQIALVELDSTYYGTPRAKDVERWAEQTPEDFIFTAKVPRQVTREPDPCGDAPLREMRRFLEVIRLLGDKLGPVVFQMSPSFHYPKGLAGLERLLARLPDLGGDGLRFAIEFRHRSWFKDDAPAAALAKHSVAWVWNDWEPEYPQRVRLVRAIDDPKAAKVTADHFAYVRLTGSHAAPFDGQTLNPARLPELARWAGLVEAFRQGRDDRTAYVLVSNHYAGSAPLAVWEIERLLGVQRSSANPPHQGTRPRLPGF